MEKAAEPARKAKSKGKKEDVIVINDEEPMSREVNRATVKEEEPDEDAFLSPTVPPENEARVSSPNQSSPPADPLTPDVIQRLLQHNNELQRQLEGTQRIANEYRIRMEYAEGALETKNGIRVNVEEEKRRADELQEKLDELTKQNEQLRKRAENASTSKIKVTAEKTEIQDQLADEKQNAAREKNRHEKKESKMSREIDSLKEKLKENAKTMKELRAEIKSKNGKKSDLKEVEAKHNEILKKERKAAADAQKELRKSESELKAENSALKEKVEELQVTIRTLGDSNSQLKESELTKENASLKEQMAETNRTIGELRDEIAQKHSELMRHAEILREELKKQQDQFDYDRKKDKERIRELTDERNGLLEIRAEIDKTTKELKKQNLKRTSPPPAVIPATRARLDDATAPIDPRLGRSMIAETSVQEVPVAGTSHQPTNGWMPDMSHTRSQLAPQLPPFRPPGMPPAPTDPRNKTIDNNFRIPKKPHPQAPAVPHKTNNKINKRTSGFDMSNRASTSRPQQPQHQSRVPHQNRGGAPRRENHNNPVMPPNSATTARSAAKKPDNRATTNNFSDGNMAMQGPASFTKPTSGLSAYNASTTAHQPAKQPNNWTTISMGGSNFGALTPAPISPYSPFAMSALVLPEPRPYRRPPTPDMDSIFPPDEPSVCQPVPPQRYQPGLDAWGRGASAADSDIQVIEPVQKANGEITAKQRAQSTRAATIGSETSVYVHADAHPTNILQMCKESNRSMSLATAVGHIRNAVGMEWKGGAMAMPAACETLQCDICILGMAVKPEYVIDHFLGEHHIGMVREFNGYVSMPALMFWVGQIHEKLQQK